jgi:polysaccharide pyruvyl transferase WcaK-like protein
LKTAIQIKETSKNKEHIDITGHGRSPDEILALIRRLDFLIGMRLHSLIFAAVLWVPFAAIEYEVKVGNLLDEMELRSASISSNGSLVPDDCSILFKVWYQRDSIATAIEKALPAMRKGAERNFELLDRALDKAS